MRTSATLSAVDKITELDSHDDDAKHSDVGVEHESDTVAERAVAGAPDAAAQHLSEPGTESAHPAARTTRLWQPGFAGVRDASPSGSPRAPRLTWSRYPPAEDSPRAFDARSVGAALSGRPWRCSGSHRTGSCRVGNKPRCAGVHERARYLLRAGHVRPLQRSGQRLLAHEVAHVIQQAPVNNLPSRRSRPVAQGWRA